MQGRYRFSVAHEIGHWRLHRPYVAKDPNRAALFDAPSEPTVVCRTSQENEPIEWQANFYSSCLLMPRRRVRYEWKECLGRTRPLLLSDLQPNGQVTMRAQTLIHEQAATKLHRLTMRSSRMLQTNRAAIWRVAGGDAHPLGETRVAAPAGTTAELACGGTVTLFFEEDVNCQLDIQM
jgi:hypothetical protein